MIFENNVGKVYAEGNKIYVSTICYRNVTEVFDHDPVVINLLYYKYVYDIQNLEKMKP